MGYADPIEKPGLPTVIQLLPLYFMTVTPLLAVAPSSYATYGVSLPSNYMQQSITQNQLLIYINAVVIKMLMQF